MSKLEMSMSKVFEIRLKLIEVRMLTARVNICGPVRPFVKTRVFLFSSRMYV